MLKAYVVFPGETPIDEGCLLVFAETRNKARKFAHGHFWGECEYIYMTALRRPSWDSIAKGEVTYCVETNDGLPNGCVPFYVDTE